MRKGIVLLGFLMTFAAATGTASATAITPDTGWHEFLFGGPGSAATACGGGCVGTVPASDSPAPPWTFSGPATVTVLDLFASGDTFELFDNLVSLGISSAPGGAGACGNVVACALADSANYSRLVVNLGAGAHSLTINAVASPFGGGAAVFAVATPEPTSMLLLGSGLAGVAARIRRRRKAAKA